MSEKLSANLNIIQSAPIELELLDGDLNIIQKLDDEPNDVGGLTSAELKAKFDESGNIIKTYINETLIPAVLAEDATEESRKQAEAARVAAEQVRQSNEAARQNAESQRVSAENARNVWEDYSASKAYAVGNKVAYGGSSYLCIKPCTGIAPPNAEYWRLIAAKGAKGDTGAQGAQGPQGTIGPEGPMGGSSNFVRYDLAQSLTAAEQAQARGNINAAPDGFGYGGALDTVSGATDEEFLAAVEAKLAAMPYMVGSMQINWGSYPALDGLARVGTLAKHNGGQYASITGYSYGGTAITRCKNAGTWGPWEWCNPLLALGVEYRTTERYLGKPVYTMAFPFGALPNASDKVVAMPGTDSTCKIIEIHGYASNEMTLPGVSGTSTGSQVTLTGVGNRAYVITGSDRSSATATIVAKYIKTTD